MYSAITAILRTKPVTPAVAIRSTVPTNPIESRENRTAPQRGVSQGQVGMWSIKKQSEPREFLTFADYEIVSLWKSVTFLTATFKHIYKIYQIFIIDAAKVWSYKNIIKGEILKCE
jgi:hypothetical protein